MISYFISWPSYRTFPARSSSTNKPSAISKVDPNSWIPFPISTLTQSFSTANLAQRKQCRSFIPAPTSSFMQSKALANQDKMRSTHSAKFSLPYHFCSMYFRQECTYSNLKFWRISLCQVRSPKLEKIQFRTNSIPSPRRKLLFQEKEAV